MRQVAKKVLKSLRMYRIAMYLFYRIFPMWMPDRRTTISFFSQFIKQGDLCFDVGANRGDITKAFLALGARVVCIEPQEVCLIHLNKLLKNNKNVIIVGKAVADREGEVVFSICEDRNTISTMSNTFKAASRYARDHQWTKTQKVATTTLDALIQLYGTPDFCKIDVEGAEELVLKGLTRPVHLVSFEYTKELHADAKKCINYLLSLGQANFNFSIAASMELLLPTWVTSDELFERLESSQDELLVGDIYARFLPS